LLDWAERRPAAASGFVANLQSTRRFQRLEANDRSEPLIPPADFEARYVGFAMTQMFRADQAPSISRALRKLCPSGRSLFDVDAAKYADARRLGRMSSGRLDRPRTDDNPSMFHDFLVPQRLVAPWVRSVEFFVEHRLPSVVLVVALTVLDESVAQTYEEELRKAVLPIVELDPLFSLNVGNGASYVGVESARREHVVDWLHAVRLPVYDLVFRRYLPKGYFPTPARRCALPIIDVLTADTSEELNSDWAGKCEQWCRYAERSGWASLRSETTLLSIPHGGPMFDDNPTNVWTLVVKEANGNQVAQQRGFPGILRSLSGVTHAAAVDLYSDLISTSLTQFKNTLSRYTYDFLSLVRQAKLFDGVLSEWVLFERIESEYKERDQFDSLLPQLQIGKEDGATYFKRLFTHRFKVTRREMTTMISYFSRAIEARNIGAMYRLTFLALLIAGVSLIVSIVALKR
jgi:hypothetical protein